MRSIALFIYQANSGVMSMPESDLNQITVEFLVIPITGRSAKFVIGKDIDAEV